MDEWQNGDEAVYMDKLVGVVDEVDNEAREATFIFGYGSHTRAKFENLRNRGPGEIG